MGMQNPDLALLTKLDTGGIFWTGSSGVCKPSVLYYFPDLNASVGIAAPGALYYGYGAERGSAEALRTDGNPAVRICDGGCTLLQ